jgi:hypothetical protein
MIYCGNILGVTKIVYSNYMGLPMDIYVYKDMFGFSQEITIFHN